MSQNNRFLLLQITSNTKSCFSLDAHVDFITLSASLQGTVIQVFWRISADTSFFILLLYCLEYSPFTASLKRHVRVTPFNCIILGSEMQASPESVFPFSKVHIIEQKTSSINLLDRNFPAVDHVDRLAHEFTSCPTYSSFIVTPSEFLTSAPSVLSGLSIV